MVRVVDSRDAAIYVRSAETHYAGHRSDAEKIAKYEAEKGATPATSKELGAITLELCDAHFNSWTREPLYQIIVGGKKPYEVIEVDQTRLVSISGSEARLYMIYATNLAKTRNAYRAMRDIWHEEAISEAQAAGVKLNLTE